MGGQPRLEERRLNGDLKMKGKSAFTQREAETIRQKLREVHRGDRDLQRRLREKLRAMGFYISDFSRSSHGFTASDFDSLVQCGTITIV